MTTPVDADEHAFWDAAACSALAGAANAAESNEVLAAFAARCADALLAERRKRLVEAEK